MKRGILPEYFIKPDPLLTRQETRHYIRAGLSSFLTGAPFLRDARALLALVSSGVANANAPDLEDLKAGLWPVGRLVALARLLGTDDLADVGAVALAICQSHLDASEELERIADANADADADADDDGHSDQASVSPAAASEDEEGADADADAVTETESQEPSESAEINHVAQGFIMTDLLSNGKTIRPYWDHSPFRALRAAPPLGSSSSSPFFAGSVRPSLDDLLEVWVDRACNGFYTVCAGVGLAIPGVLVGWILYRVL